MAFLLWREQLKKRIFLLLVSDNVQKDQLNKVELSKKWLFFDIKEKHPSALGLKQEPSEGFCDNLGWEKARMKTGSNPGLVSWLLSLQPLHFD